MVLQPNTKAPYTSASAAVTAIDAFRDRGLGVPVDTEVLIRAGVSETIAKRTVNSLKELDLLDKDGVPTSTFEGFKSVRSDDEYRTHLQEWVRTIYADVLQYCDPSTDEATKVQDAFRGYQPEGQRPAMASLLIGLWEYAGLPTPERAASSSGSRDKTSRKRSKGNGKTASKTTTKTEGKEVNVGLLFGVTDSDIAALSEVEFDEVWSALGKVARARARQTAEGPKDSQVSEEDGP